MRRFVYYVPNRHPTDPAMSGLGADLTGGVTDAIVAAIEPKVREIVVQDVLPAILVGLVAGAAIAAAIGSYFATRRSDGGRRRAA